MDTRRLSTAETRLRARYQILEDYGSHMLAVSKLTKAQKRLYKIDLTSVKSEERKWAVMDNIHEYKGFHLLPCMVRLGETFRDEDLFYVVQDVIENGTLQDEVDSAQTANVPLPEGSIKIWLCQIILALNALHTRKVVHGAVTLSNIFILGKNDCVRLGPTQEFLSLYKNPIAANHQISTFKTGNKAKDVTDNFTTSCDSMECLDHLAPEMFNASGTLAFTNDVWALGILAFKLATFQAPFCGNTPVEMVNSIQKKEPNWDLIAKRGYSQEFINLMKEMLAKHLNDRTTCRHLLNMEYFPGNASFE